MAGQVATYRRPVSSVNLELPLTLVALAAAAITPNVFVAGGFQLMPASMLAKYVLLPAIVVQLAILFYARGAGHRRLVNRLVTGAWVGLVATTGLDIVRQPGTFFGYLQHDEARMAGEMILGGGQGHGPKPVHGAPAAGHAPMTRGGEAHHVGAADFIGYAFHYWNGASFAVVYALVFGRTPWWGPLLYALLFIETGMLVFMQAAMPPLTWGVVLVSFFAHVVYGLVLGVLFARFLRDEGTILQLVTQLRLQRA